MSQTDIVQFSIDFANSLRNSYGDNDYDANKVLMLLTRYVRGGNDFHNYDVHQLQADVDAYRQWITTQDNDYMLVNMDLFLVFTSTTAAPPTSSYTTQSSTLMGDNLRRDIYDELFDAINNHDVKRVRDLLKYAKDNNLHIRSKHLLLKSAILENSLNMVKLLVDNIDYNYVDYKNARDTAQLHNRKEVLRYLNNLHDDGKFPI